MNDDQAGAVSSDPLRTFGVALYIVALLLVITPVVDLTLNFLPVVPTEISWRYGTVGMLSGFVLTPLLGVTIAALTAHILQHRSVMRIVAITNFSIALLLLAVTVMFVLDAIQMRASVPPERIRLFDIGAARAIAKNMATAVAMAFLGVAGIRALSRMGTPHPDWIPQIIVSPELEAMGAVPGGTAQRESGGTALARATAARGETPVAPPVGPVHGTAVAGTASQTEVSTNLPVVPEDAYTGRTIVWYTGALAGQTSTVTGYRADSSAITFEEMSQTPAEGDRFVLVAT